MLHTEEITIDEKMGAKLTVMTQYLTDADTPERRRPAVLIFPGGGYMVCSDPEGENIAAPYIAAGYQAFVLRYAVGTDRPWPAPLDEYETVMKLIRKNSAKWYVDPEKVAVIGFSAGGHLAGCAATIAKYRPAAAILVYGALDAASAALCRDGLPDPSKEVDDQTPPCFLVTAADDTLLGSDPTLAFAQSLAKYGIRYEAHIYSAGEHGFASGHSGYNGNLSCSRITGWQPDSVAFLEELFGRVTMKGMTEPLFGSKITGDRDPQLSVQCTVAHLREQPQAAAVITPIYQKLEETIQTMYGPVSGQIMTFVQTMPLSTILLLTNTTEKDLQALDAVLRQFSNQMEEITL